MARITPVVAWTMNAVRVADPSVWNQLMSPGTFRNRKYRTPPTSPDRSSSQSIGYRIRSRVVVGVVAAIRCRSSAARGLNRIEPRLGPVDVHAGERVVPLEDLRRAARALDLGDGVRAAEQDAAVHDRELEAVERAHRRACDAVALGVVLAAVAGAAEARG